MRRDPLASVVGLRKLAERASAGALAASIARLEAARSAVADPPASGPLGRLGRASFLEERARLHLAWALRGAQLARLEDARAAQERARGAWSEAAAELRAAERLVARRARRARLAAARQEQRDLDEAALGQWRRRRHG